MKKPINWNDPIRFTIHRNKDGEDYLKSACAKGWEGLVAKDRRSTYQHPLNKK